MTRDTDESTNLSMKYIQDSGECWVGGATWNGKAVIRKSACSWVTTEDDINGSVNAFMTARKQALKELNNT